MLKIENLDSGYGKMKVLEGVSIEIGNESVGLFGPNGAGKSTLIGAIMGITSPGMARSSSTGRASAARTLS